MSSALPDFSIAEVKRFLELWTSSSKNRDRVEHDHAGIVEDYGPIPEAADLKVLIDGSVWAKSYPDADPKIPVYVQRYWDWQRDKVAWREQVKIECTPTDPRFRAWRQRQLRRSLNDNGPAAESFLIHTPLAFEFAKGCSVGCWYCGCDAPPLQALHPYSEENARSWRQILGACLDLFGPATKWACSYWASDPFDNPDYERFMVDFHELTGVFPQTTTALPDADLPRTKRLLALSEGRGTRVNRFSIQTIGMLDRVLSYFSAEELLNVELVLQNKESSNLKANAGRFYTTAKKNPKLIQFEKDKLARRPDQDPDAENLGEEFLLPGTNSCMSGFWVNLVERSIKLVSPTPGCERWPKGYILFEEVHYEHADDFLAAIEGMMARHMDTTLNKDSPVEFARCFNEFAESEDGFSVSSAYRRIEITDDRRANLVRHIARMIAEGRSTPGEIALVCAFQCGAPEGLTKGMLQNYFDMGLLLEEPGLKGTLTPRRWKAATAEC